MEAEVIKHKKKQKEWERKKTFMRDKIIWLEKENKTLGRQIAKTYSSKEEVKKLKEEIEKLTSEIDTLHVHNITLHKQLEEERGSKEEYVPEDTSTPNEDKTAQETSDQQEKSDKIMT